ncbi:MAG: AI-2E family transporter [Erysipelotrichaceae bacterium]|nr:AI-2E family transporter [Erysipelotrichaceae bacterium]
MHKWLNDENVRKQIFIYTLTGVLVLLAWFLLAHFSRILSFLKEFFRVIMPFLWGALISLLMMPLSNRIEKWIGDRLSPKKKRAVSAIVSVLFLLVCVIVVIVIIVPQLVTSFAVLSKNVNDFLSNSQGFSELLEKQFHLSKEMIEMINSYSRELLSAIMSTVNSTVPKIVSIFSNTVTAIVNFFIGFIVAIYILLDRENLIGGFRRFFLVILPDKQYASAKRVVHMTMEKLGKFFSGKLIDSLIIGLICFLAMLVLRLDYPVLISVVIGVTNIIPFFGPFIGALPSSLILLINDPWDAVIFLIMILVLQQLDGNIIGPRILGDSVGLSSIWIMFAIIVGGNYFGFYGMLFGVPVFAVIYYLIKYYVDSQIEERSKNES